MEIWQIAAIVSLLLAVALVLVWLILHARGQKVQKSDISQATLADLPEKDVEHIFNENFREELRNRGRQYFDKIIGENAMFLQQDLRLTGSELNEFMKQEITRTLQEEFKKYEQSIGDAKQIALNTIEKTRQAIEQQRDALSDQMRKELDEEKARYMERFEKNMAEIVNHYVLGAIGDQISLDDQLEYILDGLEANKKEIIEDIRNGA